MNKSIVFPVNNKGGVGKTSLLVDLMTMLTINYNVGAIDTDGQATFYSTLTGDDSKCHNLDTDNIETVVSTLHEGAEFKFSQGSKRMKVNVDPAKAITTLFPVGTLHDDPVAIFRLEEILKEEMADTDIVAVDLPPIPHAGIILKESIMPIYEKLGYRTQLFPLIILTPEKNTIDIGLKGYAAIKEYLRKQAVPLKHIHPVAITNKYGRLTSEVRAKLEKAGITFDPHVKTGFVDFRKKFKLNGDNVRNIRMPYLEGLEGEDFCLLREKNPKLRNLPEIYKQVIASGYYHAQEDLSGLDFTYVREMDKLCSFIKAHTRAPVKKNYQVHKNINKSSHSKTNLVNNIRTALNDVYQMWENNEDAGEVYDIEDVRVRQKRNNTLDIYVPEDKLSAETLARAIADTEADLGLKIEPWTNEDWTCGNYEAILAQVRDDAHRNELLKAGKYWGSSMMEITLVPYYPRSQDDYPNAFEEDNLKRQKERFDIFLSHLDKALRT